MIYGMPSAMTAGPTGGMMTETATEGAGSSLGSSLGPIGLGLGAVSGIANMFLQEDANRTSKEIANDNRLFAMNMSNTAHQREVEDLKKAGLNPILSAGQGASTPSGSMPSITAPQINMPDMMAYGVSLKQLEQADQRLQIDKANSAAGIANTLSDTDLKRAETILKGKGMLRAEVESSAAGMLKSIIDGVKTPGRLTTPEIIKEMQTPADENPMGY